MGMVTETPAPPRFPRPDAPSPAGRTSPGHRDTTHSGHVWAALFTIGSLVFSLAGLARVAYLLFVPATVVVALWMLWTRRSYAFLMFTAWLWMLTPFARRVIEWKAGYHASSLILIPPAVIGIMAIPVALSHRRRVDRTIAAAFIIGIVTFAYGAMIGLLRNGVTGTGIDVLAIIGPFGGGLFALLVPKDGAKFRRAVLQLAVAATIVIGVYGVLQFFIVPAWDAKWMIDSGVITTGKPRPGLIRVFSTLNTSTPFAEVVAALTLVSLAERRWYLRGAVLVSGLMSLGLSLVRTAWIGIGLATVGLLNNGRVRARTLGIFCLAALVGLIILGGPVAGSLYQRFDKSISSGSNDTSIRDRLSFQSSIAGSTFTDPVGDGMGSTGTALKLGTTGPITDPHFKSFDSGVFENATTYGFVLGLALVGSLAAANIAAWRRSRRLSSPIMAFSAAAVTSLMVSMFFTNTVKNAPGFVLWLLLAVCASTTAGEAKTSALRQLRLKERRPPVPQTSPGRRLP
jgi:hypothetical protein